MQLAIEISIGLLRVLFDPAAKAVVKANDEQELSSAARGSNDKASYSCSCIEDQTIRWATLSYSTYHDYSHHHGLFRNSVVVKKRVVLVYSVNTCSLNRLFSN